MDAEQDVEPAKVSKLLHPKLLGELAVGPGVVAICTSFSFLVASFPRLQSLVSSKTCGRPLVISPSLQRSLIPIF
jgi:hypothetical protein